MVNSRLPIRLVKLAAAAVLLAALYRMVPWSEVRGVLARLEGVWLLAALALFVPQTLLSAWRWQLLVRPWARLSLAGSVRHTLVASAWNLIVPAKLGDLTKAAMIDNTSVADRAALGSRAVGEKLADLAALTLWMLAGQLGWSGIAGMSLVAVVACLMLARRDRAATPWSWALAATLVLWLAHLGQIGLFMGAAGVWVEVPRILSRVPAAIFAGLLPLSFCGIGTRDTALVWLFADSASSAAMAAVGLLTALRYLVPAAAGIVLLLAERRRVAGSTRVNAAPPVSALS